MTTKTPQVEYPKRQAFLDDCAPYTKVGLTDHFIRGYDDRECGRSHAFVGSTLAGDAYRAGWQAAAKWIARD